MTRPSRTFRFIRWSPLPCRVGIALLALLGAAQSAYALTASELYARLAPSIWVVRTYDADGRPLMLGSAVVIGPQTLVTNCHVLGKAKRVEVRHEKMMSPATLELWDAARDLCQLKAPPAFNAPAVALADEQTLVVGQTVYALGTPAGLELTLSAGIVSALRRDDAQRLAVIQTSAAISHGSSGGGLFDEQGRLIGITSASIGGDAQNLNLARPVSMVRELPQRHALAQRARAAVPESISPSDSTPTITTPAPATPSPAPQPTFAAWSGTWSGEYHCGTYKGTGKVDHPGAWSVPVMMTVTTVGNVSIVRGDATISETVAGDIASNLSVDLKGRGVYKARPDGYYWLTHVSGQFAGNGRDQHFDGRGEMTTTGGDVTRECSVTLTKSAGTN